MRSREGTGLSAFSQGEWDYVPIEEILDRVKPTQDALQLLFGAVGWSGYRRADRDEAVLERPRRSGSRRAKRDHPLPPDQGAPCGAGPRLGRRGQREVVDGESDLEPWLLDSHARVRRR